MKNKIKNNSMSQNSINLINELLDNEYNLAFDDQDYQRGIEEVQKELDLILIKK